MSKTPFVSIITPSFNSEYFLSKAIESLRGQSYKNFEHIIIDGGSQDGTISLLEKYQNEYPLRWISEKDNGIADAMNKGFRMARGEVVTWLDADNWLEDGILERIAKIFQANHELDILYGNVKVVNGANSFICFPPKELTYRRALLYQYGAIPLQPGVFFRKKLFFSVGGFDIKYKIDTDYDFWLRVLKINPVINYIDEIFGFYRAEKSSASQSVKGLMKGFFELYEICRKNDQPVSGKIILFGQYTKGLCAAIRNKFRHARN